MALLWLRPTAKLFVVAPVPISSSKSSSMAATRCSLSDPRWRQGERRKLPVLLFDVMDTLVRDPFYHDVPAFFKMTMKELLESKHPTVWIEFEKGMIGEMELAKNFFKDQRHIDLDGLKECMVNGYDYLGGIEALLQSLKKQNYEMHAFTNYPIWYMLIEEKLKISQYLSWTFCSCVIGKRKPSPDSYSEVVKRLDADPANCVFIDDRMANVEAARNAGIVGLHFKNTETLRQDLSLLGVEFPAQDNL